MKSIFENLVKGEVRIKGLHKNFLIGEINKYRINNSFDDNVGFLVREAGLILFPLDCWRLGFEKEIPYSDITIIWAHYKGEAEKQPTALQSAA